MANGKNVVAMLFLTTIVAVAATRPAEPYGAAEENTLKMATPSRKGVDATLAATRVVAAEKSIKKAESATTPEKAAAAKQDGAKSASAALKYNAISQQATGKVSPISPGRKEAAGTLAAAHYAATEKSIKKAETATTPEKAVAAKRDAAKSVDDALKYGAISRKAAGTSSSTSPNSKEATTDLAAMHTAAGKMSTKKAETATTPEEAATAKRAAAKSTTAASKYGVISQQAAGTSSSTSPNRKEAVGTLADAHIAAVEKSIKKAETATRPEEAAPAKKDAAKSEADAMKYGAISQQAANKNGA
ncbi:trinucleotide repeat-containing gene 18 protein-like [Triticum dicoccoides]|uniref:trinucleotide repeat-containing gene 18 protein-like n=1 Tax=Triticum dicoccoides TaxID=85692 RepID=UPI001891D09A|nr:trinucleotide repeat-containing gene 18 protein-like [Triticum dicoccoides]